MVPFQVSSQRRSSSVPHSLSFLFSCFHPWRGRGPSGGLVGWIGSTAPCPMGLGCGPAWRRCPLGGGGGVGAWRRGRARAPLACVPRSGLRSTRGIWSVVAWGGPAPVVPWVAGGLVGAGPWLPVGVGGPGGRRSHRPSSGLQRTSCRGKRGGRCCCAVSDRVGDACGWWRARSAVLFPASPDPWGVVLMLLVRVVWVLEWMIVPQAVPLVRVVLALV